MFLRIATSMFLAVLLILQSVVPCCAISKLLAGDGSSEAEATYVSHHCLCCPHSRSQQEPTPSDDSHSPDGKCPYCGGLLFHSALDDVVSISEGYLVLALFGDAPKRTSEQAPVFRQIFQRQVLGQPFLNTGMRLLI